MGPGEVISLLIVVLIPTIFLSYSHHFCTLTSRCAIPANLQCSARPTAHPAEPLANGQCEHCEHSRRAPGKG